MNNQGMIIENNAFYVFYALVRRARQQYLSSLDLNLIADNKKS